VVHSGTPLVGLVAPRCHHNSINLSIPGQSRDILEVPRKPAACVQLHIPVGG